ncbi:MAG: hypothetical protein Q4A10_08270 [Aerococcaceae bacterium]|nr:hypothetical protein [Aerococcaceae bacterium]
MNYKKSTFVFDEKTALSKGWTQTQQTSTVHTASTKTGAVKVIVGAIGVVAGPSIAKAAAGANVPDIASRTAGFLLNKSVESVNFSDTYYTVKTYHKQGNGMTEVVSVIEEYKDENKTQLLHRTVTEPVTITSNQLKN